MNLDDFEALALAIYNAKAMPEGKALPWNILTDGERERAKEGAKRILHELGRVGFSIVKL